MKKIAAALGATLLTLAAAPAATAAPATVQAAPASSTSAQCGAAWGTGAKAADPLTTAIVTNVSAASRGCFDRLVIHFEGRVSGYFVRYVDALTQPGSGESVPVAGAAALQITVVGPAHDDAGNPTYDPADRLNIVDVSGFEAFQQAVFMASFEGTTDFGLGLSAELPFRVKAVGGPGGSRLVIDVAHP